MRSAVTAAQTHAVLAWVRPAHQARTRAALNRLLDAAEELLAEKGFDEMSIVEIARCSGTSVGGFYRRFRDKEGLLHALHERFCEDARATADEALDPAKWAGAGLTEILSQVTGFLVQIHRDREGLFRAFLLRGVTDSAVRERTENIFQHIADRLRGLLEQRRDEISHPDPDTAADIALRAVLGSLDLTIQLRPNALRIDGERLTAELSRIFTSYLGARSA
jgi:AcrR family transcriptional regulator